ncbi:hypothetical protein GCM10010924_52970 [Rhizobium wenxiniae]|uniref:Uncharacterized protein n=1 Tax=Rhizobium wenxiniae TaxID=1737357 RepID=A0A7W9YDA1_9HYPH|nr:hypothetical protein [Rhizobium wenxiniae]GGG17300.1 hypothetical protein GCM10010924_52970 [Rhizobium wenxiniae]
MVWRPVSSLAANKLVFLEFDHLTSAHWIGYVNADGICEWPEKVAGCRPTGWQDTLTNISAVAKFCKQAGV